MSDELSLVQGCLRDDPRAWEQFVSTYRSRVLATALALTREQAAAEEIASAVWADLFGKRKLTSYTGKGSLEGWLRTLVAQACVDRHRKERRFVPLDENSVWSPAAKSAVDGRLGMALDRALAELSTRQRLILASHYLDGRTFSQIGQMLGTHESSISRQSNKSLEFLRKRTAHYLRLAGMSLTEAREAMGSDIGHLAFDVRERLLLVKNTP